MYVIKKKSIDLKLGEKISYLWDNKKSVMFTESINTCLKFTSKKDALEVLEALPLYYKNHCQVVAFFTCGINHEGNFEVYSWGDKINDAKEYYADSLKFWSTQKDFDYNKARAKSLVKNEVLLVDAEILDGQDKKYYLGKPAVEVTESEYYDSLEVLPPMKFGCKGFVMSEATKGVYTAVYYKENGKFFVKYCDFTDESTYKNLIG